MELTLLGMSSFIPLQMSQLNFPSGNSHSKSTFGKVEIYRDISGCLLENKQKTYVYSKLELTLLGMSSFIFKPLQTSQLNFLGGISHNKPAFGKVEIYWNFCRCFLENNCVLNAKQL